MQDLDRDTTGAFTKLRNIRPEIDVTPLASARAETERLTKATNSTSQATDRAAANIRRTALASANALRVSTDQASRLRDRLLSVGDTAGLAKLEAGLDSLRASLTRATSGLDVREARAGYADLASELNRTAREAERLNAITTASARAEAEAADAARRHASELDRLRAAHDPLYANSQRYAQALREIDTLENAGAMSAQTAGAARERAAATLATAGTQVQAYGKHAQVSGMHTANLAAQFNDVGVMLASGQSPLLLAVQQGTQISQVLNQIGGKTSVLGALQTGFMSMVNPVSLATVGAIALGAAIVQGIGKAIPPTVEFSDALEELNRSITEAGNTARAASDMAQLRDTYGEVTAEVKALAAAQRELARLDASQDLLAVRESISSMAEVGAMDVLSGFANNAKGQLRLLRHEFDLTKSEAETMQRQFDALARAEGPDEMARAFANIRTTLEGMGDEYTDLTDAQIQLLRKIVEGEDATRRLANATTGVTSSTNAATGAASDLAAQLGTAAGAAAQLLANLNGVPAAIAVLGKSVEGQIAAIQAQSNSLTLQIEEGLSAVAANRRVQLQEMIATGTERGQQLNVDQIAREWQAIEELEAAAKEQEALRDRLSEMNKPATTSTGGSASGGARTAALTEEQKAVDSLNVSLRSRLQSLQQERLELQYVASGQFETSEGAQAMAEAMIKSGGAVDQQTAAMVRQIDAAAKLNEELKTLANDPVKDWMDSVPNWIEAGQKIEMGVINALSDSISEFIKTGKFDFEKLGESILGVVADIVADKAVKELLSLFGREDGQGLGGLFGNVFGSQGDELTGATGVKDGNQLAQGGVQAAQSIRGAMLQAGQTVSQQLHHAIISAGNQSGNAVRMAHTQGGQSAATNMRMAGAQHATNVRMATTTSGQQHATQVRSAITTAGQQHASMVGAASAGGGMSGGDFGSTILNLGMTVLGGLFSEGGRTTRPVASTPVPATMFHNASHYAQGTPNTSGIPAILHDNEAVVPLSRGRKIPVDLGEGGGGTVINMPQHFEIKTPDADSFRKSAAQISAEMARSGQKALRKQG